MVKNTILLLVLVCLGSQLVAHPSSASSVFGQINDGNNQPSTLVFGNPASSPFVGASSKPAFGASSIPTTDSLGSLFQQSKSASASSHFGPSPFGASSQPAFGVFSTPAFESYCATTTPAYGSTSFPAFSNDFSAVAVSSTPAFSASGTSTSGSSSSSFNGSTMFRQKPLSGGIGSIPKSNSFVPAYGSVLSGLAPFGVPSQPAFANTDSTCGVSNTTNIGSSTPASGSLSTPAYDSLRTPFSDTSPSFSFSPSPEFSQSEFGSHPFGIATSAAGALSSPFGQCGGSRVILYSHTPAQYDLPDAKLHSISAMATYKEKSHDELRCEDYQLGDKGNQHCVSGGPTLACQSSNGMGSNTNTKKQWDPFSYSKPFASSTSTNVSVPTTFCTPNSTLSPATGVNMNTTQSSPFFQSTTPSVGQTSSPFGQTASAYNQAAPAFGQSIPAFGKSNAMVGNLFSTNSSLPSTSSFGFNNTTPSIFVPYQSAQPTQHPGGFGFVPQADATSNIFGQNNLGQPFANQGQSGQSLIAIPFGTVMTMPQMLTGGVGPMHSIQYGFSVILVVDKAAAVRVLSADKNLFLILENFMFLKL